MKEVIESLRIIVANKLNEKIGIKKKEALEVIDLELEELGNEVWTADRLDELAGKMEKINQKFKETLQCLETKN